MNVSLIELNGKAFCSGSSPVVKILDHFGDVVAERLMSFSSCNGEPYVANTSLRRVFLILPTFKHKWFRLPGSQPSRSFPSRQRQDDGCLLEEKEPAAGSWSFWDLREDKL
jgi:hypothetical protein